MTLVAEVKVEVNTARFTQKLAKRLSAGLGAAAVDLQGRINRSLAISNDEGLSPAGPGETAKRGNGDLIRSGFVEQIGPYHWRVGYRAVYALITEIGGRITSTRFMPIPVSDEAKRHRTKGGTIREFPIELTFIPTKDHDVALMVDRRDRPTFMVHYILKKTVYKPPHPYLRPAVHDPEWQRRLMALGGESVEGAATQDFVFDSLP